MAPWGKQENDQYVPPITKAFTKTTNYSLHVEPKKGEGYDNIFPALRARTCATHFQIRSGATAYPRNYYFRCHESYVFNTHVQSVRCSR